MTRDTLVHQVQNTNEKEQKVSPCVLFTTYSFKHFLFLSFAIFCGLVEESSPLGSLSSDLNSDNGEWLAILHCSLFMISWPANLTVVLFKHTSRFAF